MLRILVALLFLPVFVVAAPVPKAVPKLEEVFGEIVDEKDGCKYEMSKGGVLTITVPAVEKDAKVERESFRPGLVAREVEGDFMVTVRIAILPSASAKVTGKEKDAEVVAGVAVAKADDPQYGALGGMGQWSVDKSWSGRFFDSRKPDKTSSSSGSWDLKLKQDDCLTVRLTRRSDRVLTEFKIAGEWQGFSNRRIEGMTGSVRVGPVAFGCLDKEFSATFDEYKIELLKDEKK